MAEGAVLDWRMPVLPLSVRLALWTTAAFHGYLSLEQALAQAHRDVDLAGDPAARLALWRDLGETAVLVALPRPGDLTGMPRTALEVAGAATCAGECVYVPGMGGVLVPTLASYGPDGDEGIAAAWTAYDSEPVARHVLEAVDPGELEAELTRAVRDGEEALASAAGRPWSSRPREEAQRRLDAGRWGLPDGASPRVMRLLLTAARVAVIADEGLRLAAGGPSLDVHSSGRREAGLRRLQAAADRALAGATNVAVMQLAGWRPA